MKKIIYICVFFLFCLIDLLLYFLGGSSPGGGMNSSIFLSAIFLEITVYGTMILLELLEIQRKRGDKNV